MRKNRVYFDFYIFTNLNTSNRRFGPALAGIVWAFFTKLTELKKKIHFAWRFVSVADMIFVKSFTQARFQQIWKFTPITRKPRHVLPPKTPFKSKQMWDSPTVLLRYALSLLYNIKLIKNYTKIFEITQDMSSPAEILPNIEIIYTSAACDACDKYHVWINICESLFYDID